MKFDYVIAAISSSINGTVSLIS